MLRKMLVAFVVVCSFILPVVKIDFAFAKGDSGNYGISGDCRNIIGFTSWDCNVNINDQESLKTGIWVIAANILVDITVAAAYLVLGYVIYGGYQYIFSEGEAQKVANGKKTLVHAFIGLAIVMLANVILNTIRVALGGASFAGDCATSECVNPGVMIGSAIQWVIGVAGVVSVIFVVYGGIAYISSAGDPSKLQKAKQSIIYALIGLAIVALSEVITLFVTNLIKDSASLIDETILLKGGL